MNSLNLFFSYGHEDKSKLIVDLIKKRIEERSHKVYIDEKIRAGRDWRRELGEAIGNSDGVLAFLSKHAVRTENGSPGVCLDELSIAICIPEVVVVTILLEPENEVNAPTTISAIQRVDMSDWREKYEIGGCVFEEYFNSKFAIITEIIESDYTFEFHGEIEGLRKSLTPDTGRSRYNQLISKPMIGREWLIDIVKHYTEERNRKRFFCIYGEPGYGKSHFIAQIMHYNPQVVAGYFFEWSAQNANSIQTFICTIAFQMATMLPDYRAALIKRLKENGYYLSVGEDDKQTLTNIDRLKKQNAIKLFDFLISDIILIDGHREHIIAIDGVDEAQFNGRNPLVDLLCSEAVKKLPPWLKILLTTRNEMGICLKLQGIDAEIINLEQEESKNDIRRYLLYRLDKYIEEGLISDSTLNWICERCENTFIFAERLCEAYEKDHTVLSDLSTLPCTVKGLYFNYFERLFSNSTYEETRKKFSVLVANNGEISETMFCKILDLDTAMLAEFLENMRSFVKIITYDYGRKIAFFHKTISEWIVVPKDAGKYTVNPDIGKDLIMAFCKNSINLLKSSEFTWGFDGKKPVLTYETLRFIYDKVSEEGTYELKMDMQCDLKFLYYLQLSAYQNSCLTFSEEIHNKIKTNYSYLSTAKKKENEKYYIGSFFLEAENKIAKESDDALELFVKGQEEYADFLKNEPALHSMVESNICFLLRKEKPQEAAERLAVHLESLQNLDFPEKYFKLAITNYILSIIAYDLEKYDESLRHAQLAIDISKGFLEEPEKLCVLVYNQIGSCFQKMSEQAETLDKKKELVAKQREYKEKSLKARRKVYGKYSRYTALAYDYMARAILDYSRVYNIQLSEQAFEHVENALKIFSYVLGTQAPLYARALQTKAFLYEHINDFSNALIYQEQALEIFKSYGDLQKSAKEKTETYISRVLQKRDEQNKS